ncbi:hypothetical protein [Parasitella parasitica]|uniref:Reverse transcriptase domain-containing protein n=1 Tax=Parasitella parasitica TaxID=35722 RepID=A0A0B7N9M3_9FUNG|nr:hypothetical protein [Parasitella parasitica]
MRFRFISLINTDAKVFTRILSSRMSDTVAHLINPFQTDFVRGRFIADNGLLMKLVMEHARITQSTSIGLLLDQEKAYDRVHLVYHSAVLLCFGFPQPLADCISHLFFDSNLVINPSILFNLAFEPLLRKTLQDPSLPGFRLPLPTAPSANRLQSHLQVYSAASNALVNFHKTEVFSLSGSSRIYGSVWREVLLQHQITSWHDSRSPSPVRYLGFPLHTSLAQRDSYLTQLLERVQQGCLIHQQHGLSVHGTAAVLNSLNLSKLWHALHVLSVPVSFLRSIQSGGLGLINPDLQQCALQLRWLELHLCQSSGQHSSHPSFVLPRLIGFLASHLPTQPDPQPPPPSLDHRFCLLFPGRQPTFSRHHNSSWFLFLKALDRLPTDFSSITISAATCLEIPLAFLVLPASSTVELPRSFRSLPASIAYTLDTSHDCCMRPKRALEFGSHPNLGKKFLRLVNHNQAKLAPFFVRTSIHSRFSSLGQFPFT